MLQLPSPIEINGRKGMVVYLDKEENTVTADKASIARVTFEDGGFAQYILEPVKQSNA